MNTNCPCGSNKDYLNCCGRFISGEQLASTPEELMRSRYTAYTQANIEYIVQTMKDRAAIGYDAKEAREWAKQVKWLQLEVLNATYQSDTQGFVEFRAHYSDREKKQILYELSEFHLENGRWYYVSGIIKK